MDDMMGWIVLGIAIILVVLALRYQRQQTPSEHKPADVPRQPGERKTIAQPDQTPRAVADVAAASLLIQTGTGLHVAEVTVSPFLIGRKANCHLTLPDDRVSRQHAELRYEAGHWYILDSGSSNGVFVNQRRVSGARLQPADVIQIGSFRLEFRLTSAAMAEQVPLVPLVSDGENFEVLGQIGAGGEGRVLLARTIPQGIQVAVKVPNVQLSEHPERLIYNFQRSAMLVSNLHHPHIVSVYGHGATSDGLPYLMMEYVDGGTLRQRMTPGAPLEEPQVRAIGAQVASALGYAHSKQIIHRDVKPENVLFDQQGASKLTDFTLARLEGASSRTQAGLVLGTPHYMSPEQVRGESNLSPACDSYALGCMLYEMSTGRCPFEGSPVSVMAEHIEKTPLAPQNLNEQLSPALQELLLAMLRKPSRERPGMPEVYQRLIS